MNLKTNHHEEKSFTNLPLAVRIIAFLGIAISVGLATVYLNETTKEKYEVTRYIALALGLDWTHIHPSAGIHEDIDPEGYVTSIIVIIYIVLYFFTNTSLLYSSIFYDRRFTLPWMIFEVIGCISKVGALIFHMVVESKNLSQVFIAGSIIYTGIMIWFILIVYTTQSQWDSAYRKKMDKSDEETQSQYSFRSPVACALNLNYCSI